MEKKKTERFFFFQDFLNKKKLFFKLCVYFVFFFLKKNYRAKCEIIHENATIDDTIHSHSSKQSRWVDDVGLVVVVTILDGSGDNLCLYGKGTAYVHDCISPHGHFQSGGTGAKQSLTDETSKNTERWHQPTASCRMGKRDNMYCWCRKCANWRAPCTDNRESRM